MMAHQSEVRESVARAICIERGENPDEMLGDGGVEWYRWEQYATLADAAIAEFLEAIKKQGWPSAPREPRNPMCDAAHGDFDNLGEAGKRVV